MKNSKNKPSPAQYNSTIHEEMQEKKRKSSMEKAKKITFAMFQEKYEMKNRYPGPGFYHKPKRLRIPGIYDSHDPKSAFLMDVEYHAKTSPSNQQYNINLS